MNTHERLAAVIFAASLSILTYFAVNGAASPRDNCECLELRAIRRILEAKFHMTCDERHCEGTGDLGGGGELP
jgi:hypothetical protein